jgi:sigma-E factor negative regulatory protein RseB
MSPRLGVVLLLVGVVGALTAVGSTAGAARDAFGGGGDDDQQAVELLRGSAVAMRMTSYSGTRMLSAWGTDDATTVLVDVEHVPGQGTRISMAGGGLPDDAATFLASGRGTASEAAELELRGFDLLTDAYAVTLGPSDSVVGRPSTVVDVSRADALVARLWIDDRSGLLLRREVFDAAGRLARESAFIDLHVAESDFMEHLPPAAPEAATHGVGMGHRAGLLAAGWDCPNEAGAMRLLRIETIGRAGALHLTYSDGLSRMSVFEQRGSLAERSVRGFEPMLLGGRLVHVREGMPTYVVWEDEGLVFTAVTDAPLDSVGAVVRNAPAWDADRGFWTRVGSGLARLGGWVTPLV